jgi:hypothetical protein
MPCAAEDQPTDPDRLEAATDEAMPLAAATRATR